MLQINGRYIQKLFFWMTTFGNEVVTILYSLIYVVFSPFSQKDLKEYFLPFITLHSLQYKNALITSPSPSMPPPSPPRHLTHDSRCPGPKSCPLQAHAVYEIR